MARSGFPRRRVPTNSRGRNNRGGGGGTKLNFEKKVDERSRKVVGTSKKGGGINEKKTLSSSGEGPNKKLKGEEGGVKPERTGKLIRMHSEP